jgi:small GTP-binding protein
MGNRISRFRSVKRSKLTVLMVGLDDAGKTTILYRLLLGKTLQSPSTRGFNIETVPLDTLNADIVMCDVGGHNGLRHMWDSFIDRAEAIIFVVNSADRERMTEAREAFWGLHAKMLSRCRRGRRIVPVLLLCNKQDHLGAATPEETLIHLGLHSINTEVWRWYAQGTTATTGCGLKQGMNALLEMHRSM